MKAILVTGSRYARYHEWQPIYASALRTHWDGEESLTLIHGDASGVDIGFDKAATIIVGTEQLGVYRFPADWEHYGKSAGPIRNRHMIELLVSFRVRGAECVVLAFHSEDGLGKGTRHMADLAIANGFPVHHYRRDGSARVLTERLARISR